MPCSQIRERSGSDIAQRSLVDGIIYIGVKKSVPVGSLWQEASELAWQHSGSLHNVERVLDTRLNVVVTKHFRVAKVFSQEASA